MTETNAPLLLNDGLTLEIGEHSYIHDQTIRNPSGALTHISIGRFCSIATDLTIIGYDHHHEWITTFPFLDDAHRAEWPGTKNIPYPQAPQFGSNKSRGDITIGNDVWIGYNVKLFKGITVGNGAVIGACSLVNKSVEPYTIVAGTPARPIRRRFSDAEISALQRMEWWNWPAELINECMSFLCSSKILELEKYLASKTNLLNLNVRTPVVRRIESGQGSRMNLPKPPPTKAIRASFCNSLNGSHTRLPSVEIEPAPIGRINGNGHGNGNGHANGHAPAPLPPSANPQAALQAFHDNASDYFADVVPPQLSECHLENSRIVPSREHILPLMPKGGVCAEVGTQTGAFAKLIQSILRPSKLHIYDISYNVFDHAHFADSIQDGIVELHEGDSSTLLGQLPDQYFDFIYIDGDHSYNGIVKDLAQAARKIRDDGWIVCNDYTIYSPLEKTKYGVYRAVNEFCLNQGFEIIYLGLHKWGYHDVALRKRTA